MNSAPTQPGPDDIDDSSSLVRQQVLHRRLEGESAQDYYVYVPERAADDAPLLVAVHDISRNPLEPMQAFLAVCERYGAVLVAPHFAAERYPNFQRLGRSRDPLDQGMRADEALEAILGDVARRVQTSSDGIHLFGHGAGGRFALRFALAHPERVASAAIASAGSYTFPDPEKRFPQGIAAGQKRADLHFDPEMFLRVPMTLFECDERSDDSAAPRLEQVGESARAAGNKGREWVAAMTAAAEERQLDARVSHCQVAGAFDSLAAFAEGGQLCERALEALLGPLPGQPAMFDEGDGADEASDTNDQQASAPPSRWTRLRRVALPILLGAALIAFAAPIGLWAHYRSTHVVSRDAVVRSHIADVGARLDGVVKSVEVDAGDRVKAGQIVARLEDRHFEAKVRQASSQLEKATRELEVERLSIENERQRLESSLREVTAGSSAARAEVRAAESRVEEALRRLELQRSLAKQGLVAEERVRTAETELRTARALAAGSRAQHTAADAGEDLARVASSGIAVREKRVSVLESAIAALQAEVALAEANLEGAIIRAPDDGAVVRRIVQPGGSAGVGQPIISLWVGEEIWVEAWIDEDDLANVRVGSLATVTFKSYPDREFSGRVVTLGVSTDFELPDSEVPQPRRERMRDAPVIGVKIVLDDPEADLFPGLSAIVGIRKQAS